MGQHYWPLGPLPAIILIPFVALAYPLSTTTWQGIVQIALIYATFVTIRKISLKLGSSAIESRYWALAFTGASMYMSVAALPISGNFAHVTAVFFFWLALHEFLGRKRWWMISICCAALLSTRIPSGLVIVFFLLEIIRSDDAKNAKLKNVIQILLQFLASALLLALYNYVRFKSVFDQGYAGQIVYFPFLEAARSHGLESIVHLPANLYYMFLATPTPLYKDTVSHVLRFPFVSPGQWGLSIFFTSPYLVYLTVLRFRDRMALHGLFAVLLTATPILFFFSSGFNEYGYRYALDFFPLLFFVFMRAFLQQKGALPLLFKVLVISSCCINLYLFIVWLYV
jgi:hypothetical protein